MLMADKRQTNVFAELGNMPFEDAMRLLRDFCGYLDSIPGDNRIPTQSELELYIFKRRNNPTVEVYM